MLEQYLAALEEGYFEVKFAFEGLADENVWRRPAQGLLSVGELAGHIAYWEAIQLAGTGEETRTLAGDGGEDRKPDLSKCPVSGLLMDHRFRYQTTNLELSPSAEQLAMTADQVCAELLRVHTESVAVFKALDPDLDSSPPGYPPHYTYRHFIKYSAFHVAYHTGQMFSVRHLLGDETPDN